jgi:sporulation protein YlmC with PRC-barrel domain
MLKLMQGASVLTLAAMLAVGPASVLAQTETEGTTGTEAQTEGEAAEETVIPPAEGEGETDTAQETEVPAGEGATDTAEETVPPAEGGTDTDTVQAEPVPPASEGGLEDAPAEIEAATVEPVEGTIRMQDEDTILASDLMGARIFNTSEENVGEIDDVIVSIDGTVEGVVIGVGGFLGIGEKKVAVEMEQLSVQADEQGNPRLLLDATRESLEAAPEFVTVAEQASEAEVEAVQPTQGTTEGAGDAGTGTAPPAADE